MNRVVILGVLVTIVALTRAADAKGTDSTGLQSGTISQSATGSTPESTQSSPTGQNIEAPEKAAPTTAGPEPSLPPPPPPIFEPPPPMPAFGEPIPPPLPKHTAPKHSLLVGVRLGWLLPQGDAWTNGLPYNDAYGNKYCCRYFGQSWSAFANAGPKFELNLGARLSRYYNVFGIWEHAELTRGDDKTNFPHQDGGSSNFYGFGFRFSTAPDHTGLLVELALGYRKFTADLGDHQRLETNAAFNTRLGIGADIRFNELFSLSPLITLGSGSFSDVVIRDAKGNQVDQISGLNDRAQHVPITLEIGGYFDLFGIQR